MFVAQLPGTCIVPEGYDFVYPSPGSDVEYGGNPDRYTILCEACSPLDVADDPTSFFNSETNTSCVLHDRSRDDTDVNIVI
jgi:hypothetical protein